MKDAAILCPNCQDWKQVIIYSKHYVETIRGYELKYLCNKCGCGFSAQIAEEWLDVHV